MRHSPGDDIHRRQVAVWLILLLAAAHLAQGANCPTQAYDNAALLIAVSNPTLPEGPRPLASAGADAEELRQMFEKQFGENSVFTLKDAEATTAKVLACLDGLAKHAKARSKVVIFVSARGFASSDTADIILTSDAALDKAPGNVVPQSGNGISITEFRRKVRLMSAQGREIYLFLDLYRDPPERSKVPNLINKHLLDDRALATAATRRMILASSRDKPSFQRYYADSLKELLTRDPNLNIENLFIELKKSIEKASNSKQTPSRPEPATPKDRLDGCVLCKVSSLPGPLLASAVPSALILSSALFFQANQTTPASALDIQRKNDAVLAEEYGQRIFVRYGEGNHFYGDPLNQCETADARLRPFKLCREEYEGAAEQFKRAAELYALVPSDDSEGDRQALISLRERERFCRAQARLLEDLPVRAQAELGDPALFQFAESHNLLGISYLEQSEYALAEEQFRLAILKAPLWAYPRHNLALALVEHGDYTNAEREYRLAIEKTPVGEIRKVDSANPCFGGRSTMVVARPYLYYNLGVLLQRVNRLAEAQKQYCMAQASFDLSLEMLREKEGLDDSDTGLAELRQFAAKINLADVNNSLGALLETRKKHEQASKQFAAALLNNPELSAARFNQARIDANRVVKRDPAEARRLYQEVLNEPFCNTISSDLGCRAAKAALDKLPLVDSQ